MNENIETKKCLYRLKAYRTIGNDKTEIVLLLGENGKKWRIIAIGNYCEVLHQGLNALRNCELIQENGEILSGKQLFCHCNSLISNALSCNDAIDEITSYPLFPIYSEYRESEIETEIETIFPKCEFHQCPCGWFRVDATILEILDLDTFHNELWAELKKINQDWYNISKSQTVAIISAVLRKPTFHSELFRDTIPAAWNAR